MTIAALLDDGLYDDLDDRWSEVDIAMAGGASPITFPSTLLRIRVETLVNGTWVDTASGGYVKYEDKIIITRGRRGEQGTSPPSTCRLTFKNADRRFSPRNTTGPYYPHLVRGTQLRVFVNPGSGDSLRFTGEIPDWTPLWTSGEDRSVTIEASGMQRRLESGDDSTRSAWRRYIDGSSVQPIAYWSLEDGSTATQGTSGLTGGRPMFAVGGTASSPGVKFSSATNRTQPAYTGFEVQPVATDALPVLNFASLSGRVPASSVSPVAWTVQFVGKLYAFTGAPGADIVLARWFTPGGTFVQWDVRMRSVDGGIELVGFDSTLVGTVITTTTITSTDLMHYKITALQNGGNVDMSLRFSRMTSVGEGGSLTTDSRVGTLAALSGDIIGNPNRSTLPNSSDEIVWGHVQVYETTTGVSKLTDSVGPSGTVVSPWNGFIGDRPTDRFARTCAQEGIPYVISELVVDSQSMGPQGSSTTSAILDECEEVSEGLIDETMAGELRLASRAARWVPDVPLTLDYAHPTHGNQVFKIKPTDDDAKLRNDWTVTRDGGTSAHAERLTGLLNVNDPSTDPEGVRRRGDAATLNIQLDAQAAQYAYWRVRKGTVDEPRYPSIAFELHRNPELIPGWLALDVNGRLQVLNPPDDVGPETIVQYVEGYTEEITQFTWDVSINGSPVAAGEAYRYNDATGFARYDCSASILAASLDATATNVSLTITDNCTWAHDYGDYLIRVGGEDMTVTAVAAATGTSGAYAQTLTVTRSINGAVLSHAAGTAVRLKAPARYAL